MKLVHLVGFSTKKANKRVKAVEQYLHLPLTVMAIVDTDNSREEICGNKMPTRCNRGFYCRSYCLLAIRSAIKTSVASSWHFISTY